mmetsp:Transcript_122465/g.346269  ORF Transcript_122465/g.346269 Transcript_122465/m.346269 type:complete len:502 (-) Transcript_122465:1893-3398(-)
MAPDFRAPPKGEVLWPIALSGGAVLLAMPPLLFAVATKSGVSNNAKRSSRSSGSKPLAFCKAHLNSSVRFGPSMPIKLKSASQHALPDPCGFPSPMLPEAAGACERSSPCSADAELALLAASHSSVSSGSATAGSHSSAGSADAELGLLADSRSSIGSGNAAAGSHASTGSGSAECSMSTSAGISSAAGPSKKRSSSPLEDKSAASVVAGSPRSATSAVGGNPNGGGEPLSPANEDTASISSTKVLKFTGEMPTRSPPRALASALLLPSAILELNAGVPGASGAGESACSGCVEFSAGSTAGKCGVDSTAWPVGPARGDGSTNVVAGSGGAGSSTWVSAVSAVGTRDANSSAGGSAVVAVSPICSSSSSFSAWLSAGSAAGTIVFTSSTCVAAVSSVGTDVASSSVFVSAGSPVDTGGASSCTSISADTAICTTGASSSTCVTAGTAVGTGGASSDCVEVSVGSADGKHGMDSGIRSKGSSAIGDASAGSAPGAVETGFTT